MSRPPGRPSPIDAILRYRDDGTPITVTDAIANAMRAGSYFEPACAAAGITPRTGYEWRQIAGRLYLRARGEPLQTDKLTEHEQKCLAFSHAVEEAESGWEIGALAGLERLARGGIEQTTITKKVDADGNLIEQTTRTEFTLPSAQVLEWRLERRFPDRYGRRVEITGAEGGPVAISTEDRIAEVANTLEAYLQGHADAEAKPRKARKAIEK